MWSTAVLPSSSSQRHARWPSRCAPRKPATLLPAAAAGRDGRAGGLPRRAQARAARGGPQLRRVGPRHASQQPGPSAPGLPIPTTTTTTTSTTHTDAHPRPAPALPRRCGSARASVLDSLVRTILSQNTTDVTSHRAFSALKARFPTWGHVMAAPSGQVPEPRRAVVALRCAARGGSLAAPAAAMGLSPSALRQAPPPQPPAAGGGGHPRGRPGRDQDAAHQGARRRGTGRPGRRQASQACQAAGRQARQARGPAAHVRRHPESGLEAGGRLCPGASPARHPEQRAAQRRPSWRRWCRSAARLRAWSTCARCTRTRSRRSWCAGPAACL
jgi:hypothetical protein